jgi:hypothetical protein
MALRVYDFRDVHHTCNCQRLVTDIQRFMLVRATSTFRLRLARMGKKHARTGPDDGVTTEAKTGLRLRAWPRSRALKPRRAIADPTAQPYSAPSLPNA